MKQSNRKYWGLGDLITYRHITWNRWMRGVGRVLVKTWVRKHKKSWVRKHKTRAIALQKAIFLYGHKRY